MKEVVIIYDWVAPNLDNSMRIVVNQTQKAYYSYVMKDLKYECFKEVCKNNSDIILSVYIARKNNMYTIQRALYRLGFKSVK